MTSNRIPTKPTERVSDAQTPFTERARALRGLTKRKLADLYAELAAKEAELAEVTERADAVANAGRMERYMPLARKAQALRNEVGRLQIAIDWAQVTAGPRPILFDTQVTR